ncbi:uncharacterized protein TRIADDRAFT_51882 [Trichoplax adhaerens]|uniref:Uncharacterized protein n=1 Tax=Trichoplax adhaerens TaxID=10228 RepID=B3RL53_TRIAD|nr:hypothetical protein TRIADDRAFT_51882 [Trichoplax adhaerens]EDV29487.1 hypothetical protein TRIADDRAFT_51882 [Trichoplax adhaerens]|eukprot:XP_002108689.1 hypothetical protein TRIADDRAFT_51882 [Trichoplax adhaerens]
MATVVILRKNYLLIRLASLISYRNQSTKLKNSSWIYHHNWFTVATSKLIHRNALSTQPDKDIKPNYSFKTVNYLISTGINIAILEKSCSSLLSYDVNQVRNNFTCLKNLGISTADLISTIESTPWLLTLGENRLKRSIQFWQDFGLYEENLNNMIIKAPQILLQGIETEIKPKLNILLSLIKQRRVIIHLIQLQPSLFSFTLSDVEMRIDWLASLGFKEHDIGSIIRRLPSFLIKNFDTIQSSVEWLRSDDYSYKEIRAIINEYPGILRRDVQVMKDTKTFILKTGYTDEEFKSLILTFPTLLSFSLSSLQDRFQFAHDTLKCSLDEIKETPAIFTCNFNKIKLRYQFLQSVGRSDEVILKQLILASDRRFVRQEAESNMSIFLTFLRNH